MTLALEAGKSIPVEGMQQKGLQAALGTSQEVSRSSFDRLRASPWGRLGRKRLSWAEPILAVGYGDSSVPAPPGAA